MITVAESHKQRIIIMIMILRRRKNATACLLYGDMMGGTGKQKSQPQPSYSSSFSDQKFPIFTWTKSQYHHIDHLHSFMIIIMIIVATFLDFMTMMMMMLK